MPNNKKLDAIKNLIGSNDFYEIMDDYIRGELKELITEYEKPETDPFEHNNRRADLLSALYRTLEFYSSKKEFDEFTLSRRDHRLEQFKETLNKPVLDELAGEDWEYWSEGSPV